MQITQTPRIPLAARAAASFGVGLFLTFSQSHSAATGLLALGIFGLSYGLLSGTASIVFQKGLAAIESIPLTVVALLIGGFALMVPGTIASAGQNSTAAVAFKMLVTGWAIIAGAFELYQARRAGFKTTTGRDLLITSSFGLLLALLFLVANLDIVSQVGFFGAYLLLSGVHLGISATSPAAKSSTTKA